MAAVVAEDVVARPQVLDDRNLTNTILGLSLTYLMFVLPFTIWTLRGFVSGVPIDLEEAAAPGGTCSWTIMVPPTVRSSTATIVIPITRSGQWWTLYGVVYVRPVGESRQPYSP